MRLTLTCLLLLLTLPSVAEEFCYCGAQALSGKRFYFTHIFVGDFNQLEDYESDFNDYMETFHEYIQAPICVFDEHQASLAISYKNDQASTLGVYGAIDVVEWEP
jgi:hypothetical protein